MHAVASSVPIDSERKNSVVTHQTNISNYLRFTTIDNDNVSSLAD